MDLYNFWELYPNNFRITISTFPDRNNHFVRNLFQMFYDDIFLPKLKQRFNAPNVSSESDPVLNELVPNVFPNVEPALWIKIMTLTVYGSSPGFLIRGNLDFLVMPRPFVQFTYGPTTDSEFYAAYRESEAKFRSDTYDLALTIFFSRANLDEYIQVLRNLPSIVPDSPEAQRRDEYVGILEELKNRQSSLQE